MKDDLFKNKYRISSTRLKEWDYSQNGYYFVTFCIKNRECLFGRVCNGTIILSDIGKIADKCWQEIPLHFPFVQPDEYIIMPNHIHGIIVIDKPHDVVETQNIASEYKNKNAARTQNIASKYKNKNDARTQNIASEYKNKNAARKQDIASEYKNKNDARKQNIASLRQRQRHHQWNPNKFGPQSNNLASIIRGIKIGVKKWATQNDVCFQWQPRFYERIIKNEKELMNVRNYIIRNPLNWSKDEENPDI